MPNQTMLGIKFGFDGFLETTLISSTGINPSIGFSPLFFSLEVQTKGNAEKKGQAWLASTKITSTYTHVTYIYIHTVMSIIFFKVDLCVTVRIFRGGRVRVPHLYINTLLINLPPPNFLGQCCCVET